MWTPAPPSDLGRFFADAAPPQQPADVAIVMPTLLRPSILRAVQCVYDQQVPGRRIQLVIGADLNWTETGTLYDLLERRPAHLSAVVLTLPYSTSIRHGGVHLAVDGGALRAILSFVANAHHVAYLDDDNVWGPDHLASLFAAIEGKDWAFSQRMMVDERTDAEIAVDRWDSVGPYKGRFAAEGGLVDPNCLLVRTLAATSAFACWADPGLGRPSQRADRAFFRALKDRPYGAVGRPTVRYSVRPTNVLLTFLRDGVEF